MDGDVQNSPSILLFLRVTDPWLFSVAVLVVLATPGPTNTLLLTSGATIGVYRSLPLLVAELAGYNISISVIGLVIGPVISAAPSVQIVLRVGAGIYLLTIAAKLWRATLRGSDSAVSFRDVFITTLLNPKALLFALLIIPVTDPNGVVFLVRFSAILIFVGSAWIVIGAIAGRMIRREWSLLIPKIAAMSLSVFASVLIGSALFA
jgi:threonine/homoserine/homoserine lactone efflux protein